MIELFPLTMLGALLGLDVVSFPQAMISRPIVSATLAGALAGALHSIDAIPARWRSDLHGSPDGERTIRADDLAVLARRLAGYR